MYFVSSCVLAAASPVCLDLLRRAGTFSRPTSGDSLFCILTDLTSTEHQVFHSFVTTGSILNYKSTTDLLEDGRFISTFDYFGIKLESLSLDLFDGTVETLETGDCELKVTPDTQNLSVSQDKSCWRGVLEKTKGNVSQTGFVRQRKCVSP